MQTQEEDHLCQCLRNDTQTPKRKAKQALSANRPGHLWYLLCFFSPILNAIDSMASFFFGVFQQSCFAVLHKVHPRQTVLLQWPPASKSKPV